MIRPSFASDDPYLEGGFLPTVREALTKLHVDWEPSMLENAYNTGLSTQVPINAATRIHSRFSRNLAYKGMEFRIE